MARKVLWLVTAEKDNKLLGWIEKNYFSAKEFIGALKAASDAEGNEFRVFRLTLTNGKIYANRIIEKEKDHEDSSIATQLSASGFAPSNGADSGKAHAEGDGLPSLGRVQRTP